MTHNLYNDGTYLKNNVDWHEKESLWKANHIVRMLERNNLHPSTICEIGCGAGEIINQLSQRYNQVNFYGYEVSAQAFDICKHKAKQRLEFQFSNLLEKSECNFDVVMAIDVFEHVEDYLGFLQKLRKKGKYTIFHIPLDLSVQSVLRSYPITRLRERVGHLHYFTKETALVSLEHSGYEIVDFFYTHGSVDLPSKGWKTWLMTLPRRACFRIHEDVAVRLFGGASLMVLAQ